VALAFQLAKFKAQSLPATTAVLSRVTYCTATVLFSKLKIGTASKNHIGGHLGLTSHPAVSDRDDKTRKYVDPSLVVTTDRLWPDSLSAY
jgi:hypothetical protein